MSSAITGAILLACAHWASCGRISVQSLIESGDSGRACQSVVNATWECALEENHMSQAKCVASGADMALSIMTAGIARHSCHFCPYDSVDWPAAMKRASELRLEENKRFDYKGLCTADSAEYNMLCNPRSSWTTDRTAPRVISHREVEDIGNVTHKRFCVMVGEYVDFAGTPGYDPDSCLRRRESRCEWKTGFDGSPKSARCVLLDEAPRDTHIMRELRWRKDYAQTGPIKKIRGHRCLPKLVYPWMFKKGSASMEGPYSENDRFEIFGRGVSRQVTHQVGVVPLHQRFGDDNYYGPGDVRDSHRSLRTGACLDFDHEVDDGYFIASQLCRHHGGCIGNAFEKQDSNPPRVVIYCQKHNNCPNRVSVRK